MTSIRDFIKSGDFENTRVLRKNRRFHSRPQSLFRRYIRKVSLNRAGKIVITTFNCIFRNVNINVINFDTGSSGGDPVLHVVQLGRGDDVAFCPRIFNVCHDTLPPLFYPAVAVPTAALPTRLAGSSVSGVVTASKNADTSASSFATCVGRVVLGRVGLIRDRERSLIPPDVHLVPVGFLRFVPDCEVLHVTRFLNESAGRCVVGLPGDLGKNVERDRRRRDRHGVGRDVGNDDRGNVVVIVCFAAAVGRAGDFSHAGDRERSIGDVSAIGLVVVLQNLGRDEAFQIMETFMRTVALEAGAKLQKIVKPRFMRRIFMKGFGVVGSKMFGETAGFEQKLYENKSTHLRMDILACPYLRHCIAADARELAPLFCANDEYAYGNLPGIEFKRAGTLARGNDRCDFELTLKG